MAIAIGATPPRVAGRRGAQALVFYKVTCDVAAMAGPALARLGAYGDAVVAVGQDPPDALDAFGSMAGWSFRQVADLAPYEISNAYGIASSPTLVVVDGEGRVADVVESWHRDGMNRASATLARLLGAEPVVLSEPSDGLPSFRPG